MEQVDCVVIGAGVVGLAAGRALAKAGREVVILERECAIGSGISARNSEVIHAGIYYPRGSLKARLCVRGKSLLYAYAAERNVEHRRCGKLIVATHGDQLAELDALATAAAANGVDDLKRFSGAAVRALEPELRAHAALFSPSTGIIDTHGLMLALLGEAQDHGAVVAFGVDVVGGVIEPAGVTLRTAARSGVDDAIRATLVVNAAGLDATVVAGRLDGFPAVHAPLIHFAKGSYYALTGTHPAIHSGRAPFSHLIYPVPAPGGLGVHLTLDLAGQARFGPDVEWVTTPNYDVDSTRAAAFYSAVRAYWPGLKDGALTPAYAGVRPKLSGPGESPADFVIAGPQVHGAPGLINLFGIESPGLTASLAIGEEVARLAEMARG